MKHANKLWSILLVLALVFALSVPAFAADPATHTITIENGAVGETYTAYKIFDVTLGDTDEDGENDAFAYTIRSDSPWWDVVVGSAEADADGNYAANGLTFTHTTGTALYSVSQLETFDAAAFAALLAGNVSGKEAAGTIASYSADSNSISVGDLGYYFVTTSLGALCSLDTTNEDVTIYEKNAIPSIEKEVSEDDAAYGKTADFDLGDTIYYKLTVNTGSKNGVTESDVDTLPDGTGVNDVYTIVDALPAGVVMDDASSVVVSVNGTPWTVTSDYTAEYDAENNKLTVILGNAGDTATKLAELAANTDITITYTAKFNPDAAQVNIDTANQNNVTLTYQQQTSTSQAKVYTWKFELKKHAKGSEDHLAGATFQLEDTDGNVIPLIEVAENTYRRLLAGEDETGESVVTEFTTTSTGNVILEGLDAGTYYLNEIEAPSGYNRLPDKVKVEITSAESGEAEEKALTKGFKVNDTDVADDVADVENQAGTELPSTGGIGTTIFYIVGGLLVICAGVLLVVRKRMSAEND